MLGRTTLSAQNTKIFYSKCSAGLCAGNSKNKGTKMKIKRIILLILIITLCAIIFCFSNQPADESDNTSGGFIKFILEINPFTANLEEAEKLELQESLSHIIRKGAHFSIYALLGLLLMAYIDTYDLELKSKSLISFILGVTYAITDEVHQYFVPDRSCEFRDVCIDGSGVLFGVILVYAVLLISNKIKKRGKMNEW